LLASSILQLAGQKEGLKFAFSMVAENSAAKRISFYLKEI
jgi:hypothetical protein